MNPSINQQLSTSPGAPLAAWHVNCPVLKVMSFRIDIESEEADIILHVAGRLAGAAIEQLSDLCDPMDGRFVLELSKLKFADDAGVELIRTLCERGAKIHGASSFINLLIDGEAKWNDPI